MFFLSNKHSTVPASQYLTCFEFLKAAAQMNVSPKDCIVFEDGDLGIEAAKTAGMVVIDIRQFYK